MRCAQFTPSAPGVARGLDPRRDWIVGFALMVWARSVVGPDVALLRATVFASEGIVRSQELTGEARAKVLGEALGAVWAVAKVAMEQGVTVVVRHEPEGPKRTKQRTT